MNKLKYKNWYSLNTKHFKKQYKDNYKLFIGLLASCSARFQVKRNIKTAKIIYKDLMQDKENFLIYAISDKKAFLKKYKILNCHYNNIIKTINHDFKKPLKLNGFKINAFYNNLIGNQYFVTIDIWILRFYRLNRKQPNKSLYIKISKHIVKKAKRLNLKPCEYQALIWVYIRKKYGFKPVNFIDFL